MIAVVYITETYSKTVLVQIPDGTKRAEEKVRNYVEHKYHLGDLKFDVNNADYVDHSGEVSVGYFDRDEKKYCSPDFTLNEKGVEDEQEK